MKTSSSQTKKHFRRRSDKRRVAVIAAAALAVIAALAFFRAPFGYVIGAGVAPLRGAGLSADGFGGKVAAYFRGVNALVAERDLLRDALHAKEAELATVTARLADARLLDALAAPRRLPAGVLFSPSHTPYDTLVIDRGTAEGVEAGRVVYAPGDAAIGIVIEAYRSASLVRLFSSPGVASRVYVHGPDVAADAVGMGGGVIRVSVPQGLPVAEGDAVVLPTLSPSVFGSVSLVESDPASPFVYASVTLPVALSSLRFVTVAESAHVPPSAREIEAAIERSGPDFAGYFAWPDDPGAAPGGAAPDAAQPD